MPGNDPRAAIERLSARQARQHEAQARQNDAQAERLDKLAERIEGHFNRLEAKIDLRVDALDRDTQREFAEARRDLGELRDIVTRHGERIDAVETGRAAQVEASAEGAARGAGQAAGEVAAATARATAKGFWSSWKGWLTVAGSAVAGLAGAVQGAPFIVRFFAGLFDFLGKLK